MPRWRLKEILSAFFISMFHRRIVAEKNFERVCNILELLTVPKYSVYDLAYPLEIVVYKFNKNYALSLLWR